MIQHEKFRLVRPLIQGLKEFLKLGYPRNRKGLSWANQATSEFLRNGFKGQWPSLELDYENLILCGRREGMVSFTPRVISILPGKVQVDWRLYDDFTRFRYIRPVIILYSPQAGRGAFIIEDHDEPSDGVVIYVPQFKGQEVHVWLAFATVDEKHFSRSVYAGRVQVIDVKLP
jgi:hypothetical protein